MFSFKKIGNQRLRQKLKLMIRKQIINPRICTFEKKIIHLPLTFWVKKKTKFVKLKINKERLEFSSLNLFFYKKKWSSFFFRFPQEVLQVGRVQVIIYLPYFFKE